MAGYTGGGGGGAGVVPASRVVADDREDFPLTRVGLEAAIADLPAEGGDIYLGQGTLTIDSPVALSKNLRIFGAGIGVTILSVTAAISIFTVGNVNLTMADFSVTGNDTAGQTFLTLTATGTANKFIDIGDIRIGTDNGFTPDGTRNIFNAAGFNHNWIVTNFICVNVTTGSFYANGAGGYLRLSNVSANGELTNVSMTVEAVNATITASGDINLYRLAKISGCRFNAGGTLTVDEGSLVSGTFLIAVTFTVGADCAFSACNIQVTTLTPGASSRFTGCFIAAAVTAGGSGIVIVGCEITSFTSSTAGRDNHILKGNTFTGAGNNVTLTDCDGCIVEGNISCQVNETGTSDGNRYDNNQGFLGSTIIGDASVVNGGGPIFLYPFAGTLDIASNALLQAVSLPNAAMIRRLRATVKTAPTGQAIICDFKKVTLSTGTVGASIGTVTIADGAFTGSTTLSPNVSLAITEGLVMEVTQVGSGVAGANLSGFADCFA